jgi:Sulphur transport
MDIVIVSLMFVAATLCAAAMGFAIQRGGTCTVAAVNEAIEKHRLHRLSAMAEASLWVAGGLVLAHSLRWLGTLPVGYALTQWTVLGGALLGLGAYVNQACVFGAVARFGSGDWSYAATPVGFYVGCVTVGTVFSPPVPQPLAHASPVFLASVWVVLAFVFIAVWRVGRPLWTVRSWASVKALARQVWSPHAATAVIGIAFLLLFLLIGRWAYTEALADLARGMLTGLTAKLLLLAALFLGAWWGGKTKQVGTADATGVSAAQLLRCFVGGVLMGWGSLLIPGANDGLILIGMPLLWPYAWAAFLTMCLAIGAALLAQKVLIPRLVSH